MGLLPFIMIVEALVIDTALVPDKEADAAAGGDDISFKTLLSDTIKELCRLLLSVLVDVLPSLCCTRLEAVRRALGPLDIIFIAADRLSGKNFTPKVGIDCLVVSL